MRLEPDPIFIRDGDIWTSAGVTAGIDLALAFVEADLGYEADFLLPSNWWFFSSVRVVKRNVARLLPCRTMPGASYSCMPGSWKTY